MKHHILTHMDLSYTEILFVSFYRERSLTGNYSYVEWDWTDSSLFIKLSVKLSSISFINKNPIITLQQNIFDVLGFCVKRWGLHNAQTLIDTEFDSPIDLYFGDTINIDLSQGLLFTKENIPKEERMSQESVNRFIKKFKEKYE